MVSEACPTNPREASGLDPEAVHERLKARKREGESFTDLVDRLIDETNADWRETFGTLSEDEAAELERVVSASREATSEGLSERQEQALDAFVDVDSETDIETGSDGS
jgi:predicted CopG family antitoxin